VKRRISVYLEVNLLDQLESVATRQKLTKSVVIESAVASFLSPDSADRLEAAFARRLDRLSRQSERLEHNLAIAAETLALFIRFWLTTTLPSPASTDAAAQAKGRERYRAFLQAIGRRLAKGHSFIQEVSQDVQAQPGYDSASKPDRLTPNAAPNT
jgi:hypothetical protein